MKENQPTSAKNVIVGTLAGVGIIALLFVGLALFLGAKNPQPKVESQSAQSSSPPAAEESDVTSQYRCADPGYVTQEKVNDSTAKIGCTDGGRPFVATGAKAQQLQTQGIKLNGKKP